MSITAKLTSEKHILNRCMEHLEEIVRLSQDIFRLTESDEMGKIESLFTTRSQEISLLSELEKVVERILRETPDGIGRNDLERYKEKREKLFQDIQEIDRKVSGVLIASKDAVLAEMKELYQGKKMNDGYINTSTFSSSFIDTKE